MYTHKLSTIVARNANLLRNVVLQALLVVIIVLQLRELFFVFDSKQVLHWSSRASINQRMIVIAVVFTQPDIKCRARHR